MSLKNQIRTGVVRCGRNASVYEVARLMKENDVGAVVVVEDGEPCGIVTDRDLVLRCLAEEIADRETKVDTLMSAVVVTVRDSESLLDVVQRMEEGAIRRVPIVDGSGKLVGLVSFDDIFQLLAEEVRGLNEAVRPRRPKLEEASCS